MNTTDKPQFQHDCTECIFLGSWTGKAYADCTEILNFDLYYHPDKRVLESVIARMSDDGGDYYSGLTFADTCLPLKEAKERAEARGLLAYQREETEKPQVMPTERRPVLRNEWVLPTQVICSVSFRSKAQVQELLPGIELRTGVLRYDTYNKAYEILADKPGIVSMDRDLIWAVYFASPNAAIKIVKPLGLWAIPVGEIFHLEVSRDDRFFLVSNDHRVDITQYKAGFVGLPITDLTKAVYSWEDDIKTTKTLQQHLIENPDISLDALKLEVVATKLFNNPIMRIRIN
jgi:hypothetical protein